MLTSHLVTGRAGRALSRWPGWLRHRRVHQAWKAAVAAAVAWQIAVLVPSPAGQYPYYAPLGAVLAMYPTVASSVRQAVSSVLAIAVGTVFAVAAVTVASPNAALVAVVVGIGTLAGVWRLVGEQASWVPIAALFVLLVGGDQPLPYVAGFLGQIVLGLAVGVGVNFAVFPPLHLGGSARSLRELRDTLADQLDDLAEVALGRADTATWQNGHRSLDPLVANVRTAVMRSDDARRGNLRARWHRRQLDDLYARLLPLERVVILVQDVDQSLRETPDEAGRILVLSDDVRGPVAEALRNLATLLRAGNDQEIAGERLAASEEAFSQLARHLEAPPTAVEHTSAAAIVLVALRRTLDALTPHDESSPVPIDVNPT